ncbi:hypothetical protein MCOR27_008832 [Pyricularia oryzae]|uniref:Uncharacterized protein n=2 Tax=Pyricularia TaxID=48558 RepID=A0ABQ8NF25_PYRGI|nr:hypothetical protein MCOR19_002871 [Pyricularia oryzae]KAI6295993.1 hypothetical protein MCOR33_007244 [Pyricularia grisea]KAI6271453.1 hypothetical protein MCOR27_008832 [Pyricularia oryzae]KAI6338165.1 hypothetical protein MCOR30_003091 [Pyricularia oryzae]KAI6382565.1 hypothetical protein MCOR32_003053 [Pyricularia oryzae]
MSATMERQSIQDMVNEIRRDKDRNGPPPRLWQLMYEHDGGEFYMEVDDKDVNDAWADFVIQERMPRKYNNDVIRNEPFMIKNLVKAFRMTTYQIPSGQLRTATIAFIDTWRSNPRILASIAHREYGKGREFLQMHSVLFIESILIAQAVERAAAEMRSLDDDIAALKATATIVFAALDDKVMAEPAEQHCTPTPAGRPLDQVELHGACYLALKAEYQQKLQAKLAEMDAFVKEWQDRCLTLASLAPAPLVEGEQDLVVEEDWIVL